MLILLLKSVILYSMKKFVLIDGNSLFNRAFYATPIFTTKTGMPTNAIFGFVKLLFKIEEDLQPDYLLVAFDMKAPTFRHKMYKGYKSTRKPMPEELAVQVEPLKNLLKAMRVAIYQQEGIEADDILGTLSAKFDVHSYIYTGDRDSYQLVGPKTDVCFTKRGVSDLLCLNTENFTEETGLESPSQVVDLKSLMGDASDNIPGVAGVGEKTALNLLKSYQTLEGIYEHLEELKGAVKTKLTEGKDMAFMSYQLAKIDKNCDINVKLEDCIAPDKYSMEVKKIFTELEFRSLLMLDIFDGAEGVRVKVEYPEKIICSKYDSVVSALKNCSVFSIVLGEDFAEIYADKQYSIAVAKDIGDSKGLDYFSFIEILRQIYTDKTKTVISYDYKKQLHILHALGISPECDFQDVSLIAYLCGDKVFGSVNEYCVFNGYNTEYSAYALSELYKSGYENLKNGNMCALYQEMEKPLVPVLFQMENDGVKISFDLLNELSIQYTESLKEFKAKIFEECGVEFNLNSPAQLGKVLYEKMGITEVKKKKTEKYVTSADVLDKIRDKYPVVNYILRFRQLQKLVSAYIEGIRPLADKSSGIVHTTFHQTVTTTGRLSSSNPNLQSIPVRENEGRELRKIFVAKQGNVLLDADYSQIELRLLAHFSGCKELIEAFNSEVDIHAVTASQVFGVPLDEVTPKMRREAKAVNFGIIYGISDFGLSRNLNVSVSTAKGYIDKYFETYSAVKDYMRSNVEFAREHGYVATLSGRKRTIAEINSPNYNLRQFGERAAMNMPLQGSGADIIKLAMLGVSEELKKQGLKTKLVLQVHDELILEAPMNETEKASFILKEKMENAVKLKVPLTVEVHSGGNWYEAK